MLQNSLISALVALIVAVGFSLAHTRLYGTTDGVIHLDRLIGEHIQSYSDPEYMDKQEILAAAFSSALDEAITHYHESGVRLFVGQALVTPAVDYTDLVQARVSATIERALK